MQRADDKPTFSRGGCGDTTVCATPEQTYCASYAFGRCPSLYVGLSSIRCCDDAYQTAKQSGTVSNEQLNTLYEKCRRDAACVNPPVPEFARDLYSTTIAAGLRTSCSFF